MDAPTAIGVEGARPNISDLAAHLAASHAALPPEIRSQPLGLCLSGGADSCALAFAAARASSLISTEIVALHARHNLRGAESVGDSLSVRELCARLGLSLVEVEAPIEAGPNLEARARAARYRALRDSFPGLLATAHHRGDQAETVVLRILRGAGPIGLRGIHALRDDGIWRPFLDIPRSALEVACRDEGWAWREDVSNRDSRFLRNWIRHVWLPGGGEPLERALADVASAAARLAPAYEAHMAMLEQVASLSLDPSGFRLDLRPWQSDPSHPELDLLLERAWTRCGRRPWAMQQRHRLIADVLSGRTGRRKGGQDEVSIWGGCLLQVHGG